MNGNSLHLKASKTVNMIYWDHEYKKMWNIKSSEKYLQSLFLQGKYFILYLYNKS